MRSEPLSDPLRVLVVDDCADVTASMALLLRCWGCLAQEAHDGPEALHAAAEFHPDVVLLDVALPGPDGYQVARQLRQQPGMRRAYVATVTGYSRAEDRQQSRDAGCDEHFLKPLEPEVLLRVLEARKSARAAPPPDAPAEPTLPLQERAEARLRSNPYLALKNVSCEGRDGVLTLRGCLPSYYLKQVAQSAVAGLDGVTRIDNRIEVLTHP
jgi:CheY-like chemotaxis protein